METLVYRRQYLPIINRDVAVPDLPLDKRLSLADALNTIPGSRVTTFTINRGQRRFQLPDFEREDRFPEDWYAMLRAAAV